jgi:hypothetical protein
VRFSRLALNLARLKHEFKRRNWFVLPKGHPVCARCDRAGYQQIRTDNGIEWRCDWHVTDTIPKAVLLGEFTCRSDSGQGVAR